MSKSCGPETKVGTVNESDTYIADYTQDAAVWVRVTLQHPEQRLRPRM